MLGDEHGGVRETGPPQRRVPVRRGAGAAQHPPQVRRPHPVGGVGGAAGIQDVAQVDAEARTEDLRAPVHRLAEDGLGRVQAGGHARVLVAQAGEEEGDGPARVGRAGGQQAARVARLQRGGGVLPVAADQHPAVLEGAPPGPEGEGDVRDLLLRVGAEVRGEPVGGGFQRGGGARRQDERVPGAPGRDRGARRGLLQHDVRVGAAQAEGRDARAPRVPVAGPRAQRVRDDEGRAREVDARVGLVEVQRRWDLALADGEDRLDEPRDPRGGVQVADGGLDRAERAEAGAVGPGAERLRQRGHLHGVAHLGPGAVRLHVAHGVRGDAGPRQRVPDRPRLPVAPGRGEAGLPPAVVGDGGAADHGVARVAVGEGVLQPLEQHHARAVAADGAARARVEGAAAPVRREHAALAVQVAGGLREVDGHASGQDHVRVAGEQALAGQVDGHQRRGARRLHVEAGPG